MKGKTRLLPKSAITGRIITPAYLRKHPKTTFLERVKIKKR